MIFNLGSHLKKHLFNNLTIDNDYKRTYQQIGLKQKGPGFYRLDRLEKIATDLVVDPIHTY